MGTSRLADGFSDQMSPPVNCNTVRRVCTSGVSAILVLLSAVSDEPYQLRTVALVAVWRPPKEVQGGVQAQWYWAVKNYSVSTEAR